MKVVQITSAMSEKKESLLWALTDTGKIFGFSNHTREWIEAKLPPGCESIE